MATSKGLMMKLWVSMMSYFNDNGVFIIMRRVE